MPITWWPSPAKINLFLHICGKLDNGYHELQTLFQLLDFGDEIGIELNQTGSLEFANNVEGVASQDNLIYKAASLLLAHRKHKNLGAIFHVKKRIPMGGGLGGGSSNAATVLIALNDLWQCQLSKVELQKLGLTLGADVPLFVNGYSALAEGVGEALVAQKIPETYYLVATPNVHMSTAEVFAHPDLPRSTPKLDFSSFDIHQYFEQTQNDCEKLVCDLQTEVASLLHRLLHYAPSRMTGTGASIFAVFTSFEQAQEALEHLPENVSAFVAKGCDVSPLHKKIAQLNAM